MNLELQKHIEKIVDKWRGFDLSDVNGIINLRRTLSTYYYTLAEYKGQQEKAFLTWETDRKNQFNTLKIGFIDEGKSATDATTRSESHEKVQEARQKEVKHEREYKQAKDILNSLDHILNAMSSAINQATNERKQGGFHT